LIGLYTHFWEVKTHTQSYTRIQLCLLSFIKSVITQNLDLQVCEVHYMKDGYIYLPLVQKSRNIRQFQSTKRSNFPLMLIILWKKTMEPIWFCHTMNKVFFLCTKTFFKKLVSKIYELVSYRINLMKTFFISELKLFSICLAAYIEYSGKSMWWKQIASPIG